MTHHTNFTDQAQNLRSAPVHSGRYHESLAMTLNTVRTSRGLILLASPAAVLNFPPPGASRRIATALARVLGVRQVAQSLWTGPNPSRTMLTVGVVADVAHGLSMVAAGLMFRRYRRAAFTDAAIAAGLGALGAAAMAVDDDLVG